MTTSRCFAAVAAICLMLSVAGCGRQMRQSKEDMFFKACWGPAGTAKVESMLQSDPSLVSIRSQTGSTPLHAAAMGGNAETVSVLVKYGAKVNATTGDGSTALSEAAELGRIEAATRLISAGADVDLADRSGQSPLHCAVFTGSLRMVKLLVQSGADVNALMTAEGSYTPLYLAKSRNAKAICAYLRQHNAKMWVPAVPEKH